MNAASQNRQCASFSYCAAKITSHQALVDSTEKWNMKNMCCVSRGWCYVYLPSSHLCSTTTLSPTVPPPRTPYPALRTPIRRMPLRNMCFHVWVSISIHTLTQPIDSFYVHLLLLDLSVPEKHDFPVTVDLPSGSKRRKPLFNSGLGANQKFD